MMFLKNYVPQWQQCGQWLGLLTMFAAPAAGAVTQEIRALFTPDSANPQRNEFLNKTPSSGYCEYYPDICRNSNTFSIRLLTRLDSNKAIPADGSPRNSAMFKVPAQWRPLTITNEDTGDVQTVEVRISGVGSNYVLSDSAAKLTGLTNAGDGHRALWKGSSWVNAPHPCVTTGMGFYGDNTYAFFWMARGESACVKVANFQIPAMSYGYLDFAYELRTPDPLKMSSGLYTGSLNYRLGPGGDFDFGDIMVPNDPDLTLNFVLDVQHTLKVDIPPGGEKVNLVPAGGWQSWLQAGRKPARLFRDQTFNISASSRFKMYYECQAWSTFDCTIKDALGRRQVELQVFVSLPNGLTDPSGQPVRHRRLKSGPEGAQIFQPGFYVDRTPGVLHFEVSKEEVEWMLRQPNVASPYTGSVTVIWDSEI
ncbi:hypothetical protein [Pseudomonas kielensis]